MQMASHGVKLSHLISKEIVEIMLGEIHSIRRQWGYDKVIFEIAVDDKPPAYLAVNVSPTSESFVVMVNSQNLINLWKNEPNVQHKHLSGGDSNVWSRDYKFELAVDGFKQGWDNPVPLAEVTFNKTIQKPSLISHLFGGGKVKNFAYLSFINGITRTIWLLANKATAFPVICYSQSEAESLAKVAGCGDASYIGVAELAKLFYEISQEKLLRGVIINKRIHPGEDFVYASFSFAGENKICRQVKPIE